MEEEKATREEMIQEAVKRMKMFKMLKSVVTDFQKGVLNRSENGGYLFWLEDEEKQLVQEYENRTGNVVFHVIKSYTDIGLMYSLLYVSSYKDEWEEEREEMQEGIHIAYVYNMVWPDCSEAGCISVRPSIGGLRRVF
jgi:hypothetical protein